MRKIPGLLISGLICIRVYCGASELDSSKPGSV